MARANVISANGILSDATDHGLSIACSCECEYSYYYVEVLASWSVDAHHGLHATLFSVPRHMVV